MPEAMIVALTGGGTAGHVSPHLALLPILKARGHSFFYIGSAGIEREMMVNAGVEFHQITTGKLRRYFSIQNFIDMFKVLLGVFQSLGILYKLKPSIVFSKGGFVSVPVAIAARILAIPVVSHESDLTPGLATKLIERFARKIIYTFPETERHFRQGNSEHVGTPIRSELFTGSKEQGLKTCGFSKEESYPVILVTGGSQGAQRINENLRMVLPELVQKYRVIHLTGKGKGIGFEHPRYRGFEFISKELADIYACSDLVIGRAGANSIFEFLSLNKPMLLIPLEAGSRGDQVHNAEAFVRQGWAKMMREADLSSVKLLAAIEELAADQDEIKKKQSVFHGREAGDKILSVLEKCAKSLH